MAEMRGHTERQKKKRDLQGLLYTMSSQIYFSFLVNGLANHDMHMDQDVDLTTRFSEPEVIWNAIFVEESRRSLIFRIVDRRYRSGQGFVHLDTYVSNDRRGCSSI